MDLDSNLDSDRPANWFGRLDLGRDEVDGPCEFLVACGSGMVGLMGMGLA